VFSLDFFIGVILSLYLFSVKFNFIPIDTARLFYVVLFIYPIIAKVRISNFNLSFQALNAFVIFFAVAAVLVNNTQELIFIRVVIEFSVRFFVSLFIAHIILKLCQFQMYRVIRVLYFAFLVQVVFYFITFFSASFQAFWLSMIDVPYGFSEDSNWRFRQFGLTGWSVYEQSVKMLLPLFMLPLAIMYNKNKGKGYLKIIAFFSVVVSIFSARTGFVGIFIFLAMIFFLSLISRSTLVSELRKDVVKLISVAIFFTIIIITYFFDSIENYLFIINRTFEIFVNLIDGKGVSSTSTDSLQHMYNIPNDIDIIFGDGIYTLSNGNYYGATDVGYLRVLFYMGLFGSVIFYMPFLAFTYQIRSVFIQLKNKIFAVSISTYLIFIFIAQAKGNIFFDGLEIIGFLFLIFHIADITVKNDQKKYNNFISQ